MKNRDLILIYRQKIGYKNSHLILNTQAGGRVVVALLYALKR